MPSIKEKVWKEGESILPDLKHYTLEIGDVSPLTDDTTELGYLITNTKTNVVESMVTIFPEAISLAYQLDKYYESFVSEQSGIATPDKGLVDLSGSKIKH